MPAMATLEPHLAHRLELRDIGHSAHVRSQVGRDAQRTPGCCAAVAGSVSRDRRGGPSACTRPARPARPCATQRPGMRRGPAGPGWEPLSEPRRIARDRCCPVARDYKVPTDSTQSSSPTASIAARMRTAGSRAPARQVSRSATGHIPDVSPDVRRAWSLPRGWTCRRPTPGHRRLSVADSTPSLSRSRPHKGEGRHRRLVDPLPINAKERADGQ